MHNVSNRMLHLTWIRRMWIGGRVWMLMAIVLGLISSGILGLCIRRWGIGMISGRCLWVRILLFCGGIVSIWQDQLPMASLPIIMLTVTILSRYCYKNGILAVYMYHITRLYMPKTKVLTARAMSMYKYMGSWCSISSREGQISLSK